MTDWHWVQKDEKNLTLMGYEQKIATLRWNESYDVWELISNLLEYSVEMDLEFEQNQTEEVKAAAVEELIDHCEEQKDWYDDQIKMLKEMQNE